MCFYANRSSAAATSIFFSTFTRRFSWCAFQHAASSLNRRFINFKSAFASPANATANDYRNQRYLTEAVEHCRNDRTKTEQDWRRYCLCLPPKLSSTLALIVLCIHCQDFFDEFQLTYLDHAAPIQNEELDRQCQKTSASASHTDHITSPSLPITNENPKKRKLPGMLNNASMSISEWRQYFSEIFTIIAISS